MLMPAVAVLLFPLFINPDNPLLVSAVSGSEPLTNSSISYLYNEGGRRLSSLSDLQSYFFDQQYNIWGDVTNFNGTTPNFFAIPNYQRNGYPQNICVQTATLAYLKYLEVRWGYNNSVFPLFNNNVGKYSNQAKTITGYESFAGAKHNFRDYSPSQVTLNGTYFKNDTAYPLAASTNDYGMGDVYNELMKISYYTIKNGAGGSNIVNGINEYLQTEKSNASYRYSSTTVNFYKATSANQDTLFNFISGNTYGKSTAVMFGDNDYQYPDEPDQSTGLGGHAMFGIYYGLSKIRKSLSSYDIVNSQEIIYDYGGGNYAAIPYYDVEDFFVIKLKLERMEKYGLFNLFTRWVEIIP